MAQQIEIEFKNMLTKADFEKLIKGFKLDKGNFKKQVNFYFDTYDFTLKQHKAALRIREKNGLYELTLKEPLGQGLLETTDILEPVVALDLIKGKTSIPEGDVYVQLQKYPLELEQIRLFGSLETERAEVTYEAGLLVFDKSRYFGKDDYEIEYEVTDIEIGKASFLALLEQYDIPINPAENKMIRFYKEKQMEHEKRVETE
ncbi:MAG TPA: CYTH domain-containing protein [Bacillus sp. (in: firmicutes)]|nr:CYTH domain-containing protein [Bacillus sp. (in: firmicutes)]